MQNRQWQVQWVVGRQRWWRQRELEQAYQTDVFVVREEEREEALMLDVGAEHELWHEKSQPRD